MGFSAFPLTDKVYPAQVQTIVVFDGILFNTGNHYNPTTGVFTCPLSGYYYFSGDLVSNGGLNYFALYKGEEVAYLVGSGESSARVSYHVTLACQKDEQVRVQISPVLQHTIQGSEVPSSLFSGHLIRDGL